MAPISRATSTSCARKRHAPRPSRRRSHRLFRRQRPAHPPWRPEPVTISARSAVSNPGSLGTRHSHGLDQFCASLDERPGLSILDLAGANQSTVSFITSHGHRLYSDDFLLQLESCFGDGDFYENQTNPVKVRHFIASALELPTGHFDGALVWDVMEYLVPPLLTTVVDCLRSRLRPGASLLAVFHAEEQ